MQPDIHSIIGIQVKITTCINTEFVGRIYSFYQPENLIVLCKGQLGNGNEESRDFVFINHNYVHNLQILDYTPERLDIDIPEVNVQRLLDDVNKKVEEKARVRESVNREASEDAQALYREFQKTLSVEWDGLDIYFKDLDVTITPPYEKQEDVSGRRAGIGAIERVIRVVRGIQLMETRRRLGLDA